MARLQYVLEVSYRLRLRNERQALRISGTESELLDSIVTTALQQGGWRGRPLPYSGVYADDFTYDSGSKRREVTWVLRNSRQARAAEKLIKRLRLSHRKMDIKTNVTLQRNQNETLEEAKKYLITTGQYKALMREGAARTCLECHQCIPKYKGRYPKNCAGCGGNVGNPLEDAVESIVENPYSADLIVNRLIENWMDKAKKKAAESVEKLKTRRANSSFQ